MRPSSASPHRLPLLLGLLLLLALAAACAPPGPLPAAGARAPVAGAPAGSATAGFRLWQDGTIFDCERRLLALAAAPGGTLLIEMYEFGRADLARALVLAHDRGADVRLIFDPTVSVSARTAARLRSLGVPVRAYPVDERRHQIDHVKLVVAGGEAVVGGMNWGSHSAANHDYALETGVQGVVTRLRAVFEQDWSLAGGVPAPLASPSGPGAAAVAQTGPGEEVRRLLEHSLGAARRSVAAEVFVLTDPDVILALTQAGRRGCQVRVLLDPGQDVNQAGYRLLSSAGVEVRWYPVPAYTLLHAKTALFDGGSLLVGSANWSRSGLSVNHELDLLAADQGAVAAYADRFERDWAASR